ncbi:hypothetical protein AB0N09_39845 [Streptomyces erythrochromogenes]|uniref:hypothetical protein n=1 Tax=Streptomyces erythrochromogenes TaxID=285574 RepID=UPI0034329067
MPEVFVPADLRVHLYADAGELLHASAVRSVLADPGRQPLRTVSGGTLPNLKFSPITDWEMLGDMTAAELGGDRGTLAFVGSDLLPSETMLCTGEGTCHGVHTCSGVLGAFARAHGATDIHILTCQALPRQLDPAMTVRTEPDSEESVLEYAETEQWVQEFLAYAWSDARGAEERFAAFPQGTQAHLLAFEGMDRWWNGRKAVRDCRAMGADFFPYFCGLEEREQLMMLSQAYWEIHRSAHLCLERDLRFGLHARASRLSEQVRERILQPHADLGSGGEEQESYGLLRTEYEQACGLVFQWPHMTAGEQRELLDDESSPLREMFGVTTEQLDFVRHSVGEAVQP